MNIKKEIEDYIKFQKDKIKNGAIRATSTALVAGMLLSGSMGLTGCEKNPVIIDPNNPTQVTTNPNDSQNPNDSKLVTPSEDFKRVEFERPIEEYTGEEKVDIFVQNYCENNDFEYDRIQLGKSFDKDNLEKVTNVMFINTNDWSSVKVTVPFEVFEECAKILNKNLSETDRTMFLDVNKDKESYEKIADYIWKMANENHPLTAREEKKQLEEIEKSVVGQLDRVMKKVVDKQPFPLAYVYKVKNISFVKSFVGTDNEDQEVYKYRLTLQYMVDSESSIINYASFGVCELTDEEFEELKNKVSVEPDPETGYYILDRKKNLDEYKMLAEYVLGILKQKYPDCFEDTMER